MHGVSHRCLLAAPDVWIMFHPHTYIYIYIIYNSQIIHHFFHYRLIWLTPQVVPEQHRYSPVTDFREARCRAFHETRCSRGGACNFMHIKHIPKAGCPGVAVCKSPGWRGNRGKPMENPSRRKAGNYMQLWIDTEVLLCHDSLHQPGFP